MRDLRPKQDYLGSLIEHSRKLRVHEEHFSGMDPTTSFGGANVLQCCTFGALDALCWLACFSGLVAYRHRSGGLFSVGQFRRASDPSWRVCSELEHRGINSDGRGYRRW